MRSFNTQLGEREMQLQSPQQPAYLACAARTGVQDGPPLSVITSCSAYLTSYLSIQIGTLASSPSFRDSNTYTGQKNECLRCLILRWEIDFFSWGGL